MKHIPVMKDEVLEYFEGVQLSTFFEGTLGAGGHAAAILEAHPEIKTYIGCDQDESALALAKKNLSGWKSKLVFHHSNFSHLDTLLAEEGVDQVDGFFLISASPRCKSMRRNGALAFQKRGH